MQPCQLDPRRDHHMILHATPHMRYSHPARHTPHMLPHSRPHHTIHQTTMPRGTTSHRTTPHCTTPRRHTTRRYRLLRVHRDGTDLTGPSTLVSLGQRHAGTEAVAAAGAEHAHCFICVHRWCGGGWGLGEHCGAYSSRLCPLGTTMGCIGCMRGTY